MQVACEVRRVLSTEPSKIHLEDFKLKFVTAQPSNQGSSDTSNQPSSQESTTGKGISGWEVTRKVWLGWAGYKMDKDGKVIGHKHQKDVGANNG